MSIEARFEVKINSERCKGCGLCVEFCPRNALEMSKSTNKTGYLFANPTNIEYCTGCGRCYMACPDCAIEVTKKG